MVIACLKSLDKSCTLAQLDSNQFKTCRLKKFVGRVFIPEVLEPNNLSCASHFDTGVSVFYGDDVCESKFLDPNEDRLALSKFEDTLPVWSKFKSALYIGSMGELYTFAPRALSNFFTKEDRRLLDTTDIGKVTRVIPSQYLLNAKYKIIRLTDYMEQCPSKQYQVNVGQRILQPFAGKSFIGEFNPLYACILTGIQVYKYFDNRAFTEELKPYRCSDKIITNKMREVTSQNNIKKLLDAYMLTYEDIDIAVRKVLMPLSPIAHAQHSANGKRSYNYDGRLYILLSVNEACKRLINSDGLVVIIYGQHIEIKTLDGRYINR